MLWGWRYWDEGCYGVRGVGDTGVVDPVGLEGLGTLGWGLYGVGGVGDTGVGGDMGGKRLGTLGWGGCYGVGDSGVVDPMGLEGLGTRCHWGRQAGGLGVGDGTFQHLHCCVCSPVLPIPNAPPAPLLDFPTLHSHCFQSPFPFLPVPIPDSPVLHPQYSLSPFPMLPPPFPVPPLPPHTHGSHLWMVLSL